MPLIHPEKEKQWALIDKCLTDDYTSIYTSDWKGPWHNYSMVSDETKITWWGDFVQKYNWDSIHDNVVHSAWKKTMMSLISNYISKRKRSGKMPPFMSFDQWNILQTYWVTESAKKKSKSASDSRCSTQCGHGQHVHTAGYSRRAFASTCAYDYFNNKLHGKSYSQYSRDHECPRAYGT